MFRTIAFAATAFAAVHATQIRAAEGPLEVTTGSYKFTARDEPLVATDRKVDLWAEVYRPKTLGASPAPLLVFLHGNHGTCGRFDKKLGVRVDDRSDYTDTGKCPDGYVVTPNHLGYAYLAEELASWGYVVVSINANRGITAGDGVSGDGGLNLMRGRLILRHLALLADWDAGKGSLKPPSSLGFDPKGALDFSQVGLMGHSRGGEGARAALQQFRDEGSPFKSAIKRLKIRSIFEIGPVDGQTDRTLDANGVNSIILLPACDGDVSDLEGVRVFDRVFTRGTPIDSVNAFHGTIEVWGANHNAYNTEWLVSDSPGCSGGERLFPKAGRSPKQQATALGSLAPFFRATVGPDAQPRLADLFDPTAALPADLTAVSDYDRGYLPGPIDGQTRVLEAFTQPTGTGDAGLPTTTAGVTVTNGEAPFGHDINARAARVDWDDTAPSQRFFQVNLSTAGRDLSGFKTFAFRTSLNCFGKICRQPPSQKGEMNFTVALVTAGGKLSKSLSMNGRTRLHRPIGNSFAGSLKSILYTVAIPLGDFGDVDLTQVTGVRFTFEKKPQGSVNLAYLTASTFAAAEPDAQVAAADEAPLETTAMAASDESNRSVSTPAADGNRIAIVRGGADAGKASAAAPAAGTASIVLKSKRAFPVTGALPKLKVGSATITGGAVSADGTTITFTTPETDLDKLEGEVSLDLLASQPVWKFGPLPK